MVAFTVWLLATSVRLAFSKQTLVWVVSKLLILCVRLLYVVAHVDSAGVKARVSIKAERICATSKFMTPLWLLSAACGSL